MRLPCWCGCSVEQDRKAEHPYFLVFNVRAARAGCEFPKTRLDCRSVTCLSQDRFAKPFWKKRRTISDLPSSAPLVYTYTIPTNSHTQDIGDLQATGLTGTITDGAGHTLADGSSLVQGSWANPTKFTAVPEFGWLALLNSIRERLGHVPEWAQNVVLYDLAFYLRIDSLFDTKPWLGTTIALITFWCLSCVTSIASCVILFVRAKRAE